MAEGPISNGLRAWTVPCLVFVGAGDDDFVDQARRAANEIPNAELLVLQEADHYATHTSPDEVMLDGVVRTLRANY